MAEPTPHFATMVVRSITVVTPLQLSPVKSAR
jgi:hypothetical protein